MQATAQRNVLRALLVALKPIAKMLLRNGIGFREFAEIAKSAFVDVSTNEYGLRGRPTNISRVAVMTGLTRKEVRRIRDKISSGDEDLVVKSNPLSEVLHRWFSTPEFLSANGTPLKLPFDGAGPSFTGLVRRFGGDIPPGAMRTELKRVKAIVEDGNGLLEAVKRDVLPHETTDKLITGLVHGLYPMASAIAYNTNPNIVGEPWTQRTAATKHVRNEDISRIRRISRDRLVEFTDSVDDLFMAYETLHGEDPTSNESETAIGIGVFYFEHSDENDEITW
ncbi:DUF6502 family protein [Woeseia oceani]|uniref:DUF6502 family protein n=1 Tax=Woeseia oceani TaxID=1548547 RepID=UPI000B11609C|nr:DUF6502 family protein [Woeseia oceani]